MTTGSRPSCAPYLQLLQPLTKRPSLLALPTGSGQCQRSKANLKQTGLLACCWARGGKAAAAVYMSAAVTLTATAAPVVLAVTVVAAAVVATAAAAAAAAMTAMVTELCGAAFWRKNLFYSTAMIAAAAADALSVAAAPVVPVVVTETAAGRGGGEVRWRAGQARFGTEGFEQEHSTRGEMRTLLEARKDGQPTIDQWGAAKARRAASLRLTGTIPTLRRR